MPACYLHTPLPTPTCRPTYLLCLLTYLTMGSARRQSQEVATHTHTHHTSYYLEEINMFCLERALSLWDFQGERSSVSEQSSPNLPCRAYVVRTPDRENYRCCSRSVLSSSVLHPSPQLQVAWANAFCNEVFPALDQSQTARTAVCATFVHYSFRHRFAVAACVAVFSAHCSFSSSSPQLTRAVGSSSSSTSFTK